MIKGIAADGRSATTSTALQWGRNVDRLLRLVWIVTGYLAATFVGSLTITVFFVVWHPLAWLMFAWVAMIKVVIPLSAPPSVIFIMWAEWKKVRHAIYYLTAGIVTSMCGVTFFTLHLYMNTPIDKFLSDANSYLPTYYALAAAGGLIAGFVYWLIAGRRATRA